MQYVHLVLNGVLWLLGVHKSAHYRLSYGHKQDCIVKDLQRDKWDTHKCGALMICSLISKLYYSIINKQNPFI